MATADALLAVYLQRVERELGHKITSNTELSEYALAEFGQDMFRGVFPSGQSPKDTAGSYFYVVNTEPVHDGHWMCVARVPGKQPLLFDSFGRTPSPHWQAHLQHMRTTDPDVDQASDTNRCGQLCLAWAMIFRVHGLDVARAV